MKEKKINIEYLRVLAIILTITIHVSNIYFYNFTKINNVGFLISVVFASISRICVPLFFMISGMLLIKEKFDKKKYLKRITRFILLLIIWSIIYVITNKTLNGNILVKIVYTIFNPSKTQGHLWFMYAIIGLYISLPFIQSMCQNMNKEKENLFLLLWGILSGIIVILVPVARYITKSNIDIIYPIPIINATYYLGYFICGYILGNRYEKEKNNKKINTICIISFIISSLITIFVTYYLSIKNNSLYEPMMWYRSMFTIISSVSIFVLFIANSDKFKNSLITNISGLTFGVYLIHMIFLNIIKDNIRVISYNPIIFIPLITISVYLVSILSCYIIKKIPVLKKII